ncbi:MAG: hypothetical protein LPK28_03285 [Bacteroidota bacterium]|nr:hypothetical protein [Bacteroidota bacterium]
MRLKKLSMFMAFLVLLTSFQVVVEKHFCLDELTDTSFFSPAETCSDIGIPSQEPSIERPSCCRVEKISTPSIDYQKIQDSPSKVRSISPAMLPNEVESPTLSCEVDNDRKNRPPPEPGIYPSGWAIRISQQSFLL